MHASGAGVVDLNSSERFFFVGARKPRVGTTGVGSLVLGRLADKWGRRRAYPLAITLMIIGNVAEIYV